MAATQFIESGSAATQDMSFYQLNQSSGTGSVSSSSQAVLGSVRSIAVATGASNGSGGIYSPNVMADAGRRMTFGFRFTGTPAPSGGAGSTFLSIDNFGTESISFCFGLTAAGKIVLMNGTGTQLAIGTTVLSASTDYRISLAYTITSTTVNTITLYINGVSEIAATNVTVSTTGTSAFGLDVGDTGWTAGSNLTCYYAHVFVDNGTTGDPGNIQVTAKRAYANGTTNNFATNGSASGYGSGNAEYVNTRPINSSDYVSVTPTSAKTEEYNIEPANTGDVNLTGVTIVDSMGWISANIASTSNTPVDKIILNGTSTTVTMATSFATYTQIAGSTSYPAGSGSDIGMSAQYTTTGHLVKMDGAGIIVAYIPAVATNHNLSLLGVGN